MGRKPRKRGPWDAREIDFLRDNHLAMTVSAIANRLGRSQASLKAKMRDLGLSWIPTRPPGRPWSHEEIRFLRTNHLKKTIPEIAQTLQRPYRSVHKKMGSLGLECLEVKSRWTPAEIKLLKTTFDASTEIVELIAEKLERTPEAVYRQARVLGLTQGADEDLKNPMLPSMQLEQMHNVPHEIKKPRGRKRKRWTEADDAFLRNNFSRMSLQEIAENLGAHRSTVRRHLASLLRTVPKPDPSSKREGWESKQVQKVKSLKARIRYQMQQFAVPLTTRERTKIQKGAYSKVDLLRRMPYFKTIRVDNLEILAYAILAQQYQETKGSRKLPFDLPLKHRRNVLKRRMVLREILAPQI